MGRLQIRSSRLKEPAITEDEVPSLIDEIPLIARCLRPQRRGSLRFEGPKSFGVKESDRIEAVAQGLRAMGVTIETRQDGFVIQGPQKLRGAKIDSQDDHRIAMAFFYRLTSGRRNY